jgi:hypothetical protein
LTPPSPTSSMCTSMSPALISTSQRTMPSSMRSPAAGCRRVHVVDYSTWTSSMGLGMQIDRIRTDITDITNCFHISIWIRIRIMSAMMDMI